MANPTSNDYDLDKYSCDEDSGSLTSWEEGGPSFDAFGEQYNDDDD